MIKNSQGITSITCWKKIHCYCPLGDDWYTNELRISFTPVNEFPDYIKLDNELEKLEKDSLIIEDVVSECYKIVQKLCPSAINIEVSSHVSDAKHLEVKVEKF